MYEIRLLFSLLLVLMGAPQLALAQTLSVQDCEDIVLRYGIEPQECSTIGPDAAQPVAPSILTQRMVESHIFFKRGGTRLDRNAIAQLKKIARVLETKPLSGSCLKLVGHSDSIGSVQANLSLSRKRAEVVSHYLGNILGDPGRIELVVGNGESNPLSGFAPEAPENRRVEILARKCPLPFAGKEPFENLEF